MPLPIVISGMGLYTPAIQGLKNVGKYHHDFHALHYPSNILEIGITPCLSSMYRPPRSEDTTQHLLKAVEEALANANINLSEWPKHRVAVVIGTSHSGLNQLSKLYQLANKNHQPTHSDVESSLISHCTDAITDRYQLTGRKITVSSACSSSLTAIGIAKELIENNKADLVLCGGCDGLALPVIAGFHSLKALCLDRCSPFGHPTGLNLGEGAAAIVVQHSPSPNSWALLGYGVASDAFHITAPDPDGGGIKRAIHTAIEQAGLTYSDINLISAHATGTPANDHVESSVYHSLFGPRTPVSVMKPFFGHTLGASGVVELVTLLASLDQGLVPANHNQTRHRQDCLPLNTDYPPEENNHCQTILATSLGFGGNNSALVVSKCYRSAQQDVESAPIAILGAGQTDGQLSTTVHQPSSPQPFNFTRHYRRFARSSPQIQFAIEAVGHAIRGHEEWVTRNPSAGLIMGLTQRPQRSLKRYLSSIYDGNPRFASAHHFPLTNMNATGGLTSIAHKVIGHSTTLSSAMTALEYSCDLLHRRTQDFMLVCASDEHGAFTATNSERDQGGAALLLAHSTSVDQYNLLAHAWILGTHHRHYQASTASQPWPECLEVCIHETLQQAGLTLENLDDCFDSSVHATPSLHDEITAYLTHHHVTLQRHTVEPLPPSSQLLFQITAAMTHCRLANQPYRALIIVVDATDTIGAVIISNQRALEND